ASFERGYAGADCFGAVADFGRARRCSQNGDADRAWLFAAWIVVGDDDAVGILRRNAAHDRALAGVAVAAGAEHHHQLADGVRPQRFERLLERVRLVGVVDEYRRAVFGARQLQPAFG